ncbi:MAG TPA: AzlD domain-containing protein [Alcanivoracaceae bacterium]|nr:AzlD domain-containing protein [Alcanivoracaceae bacterium]
MISTSYLLAAMALTALGVLTTRAIPFVLFRGHAQPPLVRYLAKTLPPLIMLTLVVYSLQRMRLWPLPEWQWHENGWPLLAATLSVTVLHLWRGNVLLSICGGTALYMALIHPTVQHLLGA